MEAWAALLIGIVLGAVGTAFGFYIRDVTIDAERWGKSMELEAMAEHDDGWRGLENVRPRVERFYDQDASP